METAIRSDELREYAQRMIKIGILNTVQTLGKQASDPNEPRCKLEDHKSKALVGNCVLCQQCILSSVSSNARYMDKIAEWSTELEHTLSESLTQRTNPDNDMFAEQIKELQEQIASLKGPIGKEQQQQLVNMFSALVQNTNETVNMLRSSNTLSTEEMANLSLSQHVVEDLRSSISLLTKYHSISPETSEQLEAVLAGLKK